MVLLRKRLLDPNKRDWTLYASGADLDTVLAIWVFLNHVRLGEENPHLHAQLMPLLRLEGAIDALGLEFEDFCGLPTDLLASTRHRMNQLRDRELELKRTGRWNRCDLLSYVADQLRAIDRMVYRESDLAESLDIEELARTEIADGAVAVVVRARDGIYEVERALRRFHGDRLGLIALQTTASSYSLRQVNPSLPASLDDLYMRLNLIDPASDGNRSSNRWGGSADIGGSPRSTGTRLSARQIAAGCRHVHGRPRVVQLIARAALAMITSAAFMLAALPHLVPGLAPASWLPGDPAQAFGAAFFALAGLSLIGIGRRAPGLYGLRLPSGLDWLLLLPLALIGAVAGGVWMPVGTVWGFASPADALLLAIVFAVPAAAELLFRGIVHGGLASVSTIQRSGGPWFLSWPVVLTSGLYAICSILPALLTASAPQNMLGAAGYPTVLLGALGFGIASGMARERAESLLPPIVLHWLGVAAVLVIRAG